MIIKMLIKETRSGFDIVFIGTEEACPVLDSESCFFKTYELQEDAKYLNIPDDFKEKIKDIGDESPMYVTFAMPFGFSRMLSANKEETIKHRYWPSNTRDSFATKIREEGLIGYRGHPGFFNEDGFAEPVVQWVSAVKAKRIVDGVESLLVRGYMYDVGNTRNLAKTNVLRSASVRALVKEKPETIENESVLLVEEANPLSFDFVPPGTEGIVGTNQLCFGGESAMEFTAEQAKFVSSLTETDLKEYNPKLVSVLGKETGEADAKLLERLQEQTNKALDFAVGYETAKKLAEVLNCDLNELISKITDLKQLAGERAKFALEAAIKELPENIRFFATKELKDKTFNSVKEAQEAVQNIHDLVKRLAADANLGSVGDMITGITGTGVISVASPYMKNQIGGKA